MDDRPLVIVGAGWLGRALAAESGAQLVAQRDLQPSHIPQAATMIVASGWSSVGADQPDRVQSELADVNATLDLARQRDARVVVIGSSDVCGLAEVVRGDAPLAPVTAYGELKAQRETLVVEAQRSGLDAVAVRLGPTHGPEKSQSARLVNAARGRVAVLPNGGRYSVGFVALPDAVSAICALAAGNATGVKSVGGGRTELGALIGSIAAALGSSPRIVSVPMPGTIARRLAASRHQRLAWIGRFSLPRVVEMEAPVQPMSVEQAGRYLVSACDAPA